MTLIERLLAALANLTRVLWFLIQVAPLLLQLRGDMVGTAAITEQPDRISATGTVR